jgi:hypothetical protein
LRAGHNGVAVAIECFKVQVVVGDKSPGDQQIDVALPKVAMQRLRQTCLESLPALENPV